MLLVVVFIIAFPTVICGLESVMLRSFYTILAEKRGLLSGQKWPLRNIRHPEGFLGCCRASTRVVHSLALLPSPRANWKCGSSALHISYSLLPIVHRRPCEAKCKLEQPWVFCKVAPAWPHNMRRVKMLSHLCLPWSKCRNIIENQALGPYMVEWWTLHASSQLYLLDVFW